MGWSLVVGMSGFFLHLWITSKEVIKIRFVHICILDWATAFRMDHIRNEEETHIWVRDTSKMIETVIVLNCNNVRMEWYTI